MFEINKNYRFSVYPASILPATYTSAKLISILDFTTAIKFDNVERLHRQIYPYLPPNTPSDNTSYTYYLFTVDGKQIVLADCWIIPSSVEVITSTHKTLKLNNVSDNQFKVVTDQIRLLGIYFDIL